MKTCLRCGQQYPDDASFCTHDGGSLVLSPKMPTGPVGTLIAGKYRILKEVGAGGMGTVFLAEQINLGRRVALKLLQGQLSSDDEMLSRFKNEAFAIGQLSHPNIVTIYEMEQTGEGELYIVMEYVTGSSLRAVLEHEGPLTPIRSLQLGKQVAGALGEAHRKGIIHRDIKPENLMVSRSEEGEESVKVLDFGIAKLKEGTISKTRAGLLLGTPRYMSYEQASGMSSGQLDGRSDIYSLGVVMYEMLAGQPPFDGANHMDVLMKHLQTPPPPLTSTRHGSSAPVELQELVLRCLSKDRDQRHTSARLLAGDLERIEFELRSRQSTRRVQAPQDDNRTVLGAEPDLTQLPAASGFPASSPTPAPMPQRPVQPGGAREGSTPLRATPPPLAERRPISEPRVPDPPVPVIPSPLVAPPAPSSARSLLGWAAVAVALLVMGVVAYKLLSPAATPPSGTSSQISGNQPAADPAPAPADTKAQPPAVTDAGGGAQPTGPPVAIPETPAKNISARSPDTNSGTAFQPATGAGGKAIVQRVERDAPAVQTQTIRRDVDPLPTGTSAVTPNQPNRDAHPAPSAKDLIVPQSFSETPGGGRPAGGTGGGSPGVANSPSSPTGGGRAPVEPGEENPSARPPARVEPKTADQGVSSIATGGTKGAGSGLVEAPDPTPANSAGGAVRPGKAAYSGPASGTMIWQGRAEKGKDLIIDGATASFGTVNGELPGVPCLVRVNDSAVSVAEAPGPRNQFRKLALRFNRGGQVSLSIVWEVLK